LIHDVDREIELSDDALGNVAVPVHAYDTRHPDMGPRLDDVAVVAHGLHDARHQDAFDHCGVPCVKDGPIAKGPLLGVLTP
jgi:hypothetical protein